MMSRIFKMLLIACCSIFLSFTSGVIPHYKLTLKINNISAIKGNLYIAIYNSELDFKNKNAFISKSIEVKGKEEIIFLSLPNGVYAVVLYQDLNNNKKLDTIFSIPLEPYGVSNNISGFPSFQKAKFNMDSDKTINIKIKN